MQWLVQGRDKFILGLAQQLERLLIVGEVERVVHPFGGIPVGGGFIVHLNYGSTEFFGTGPNYVYWTDPAHSNLQYIWSRTYPLPMVSANWL